MVEPLTFAGALQSDILWRPAAEIRALQDRLLRQTIEHCFRGHRYYQALFQQHGLTPDDFQGAADLAKLPVTTKEAFAAEPEAFVLRLPDLPLEERLIREIIYTTGTTSGVPAAIYTTTSDFYGYLVNSARSNEMVGIVETDTIANLWPLTAYPLGAYVRSTSIGAATGCAVVTMSPGRFDPDFPFNRGLDEAIRLITVHKATVLFGVASFVRRVLMRAEEVDADFSNVRLCMISGEGSSRDMRDDMLERLRRFGAASPRIVNRYGATEAGSFFECVDGGGWHNVTPEQVFIETIDETTGRRCESGEPGVLLVTHVSRRGTVLLRYAVGDVVAIDYKPCPHCGRTSERIVGQPARTHGAVKIKGMLVHLEGLAAALSEIPQIRDFQVVVQKSDSADPYSLDEIVLRIAAAGDPAEVETNAVARTIAAANVRPRIEFVDIEEIRHPDENAKLQRIVDRRPSMKGSND